MLRLCLLLFFCAGCLVHAGDIKQAEVQYEAGHYMLAINSVIDVQMNHVRPLVTDYDQLTRLNDALIESALLVDSGNGQKRRRLVWRSCVLVFCFTVTLVEDVIESEDGNVLTIVTTIDPSQSDFTYGETRWLIVGEPDQRTRIQLNGDYIPSFWVPPVVGPWLLKRKLLHEAQNTVQNIETLARDEAQG